MSVATHTQISMKMKADGRVCTIDDLGFEPQDLPSQGGNLGWGDEGDSERLAAFPSCTRSAPLPSVLLPIIRIS